MVTCGVLSVAVTSMCELQWRRSGLDLGWAALDVVQIQLERIGTYAERLCVVPCKRELVAVVVKHVSGVRWNSVGQ